MTSESRLGVLAIGNVSNGKVLCVPRQRSPCGTHVRGFAGGLQQSFPTTTNISSLSRYIILLYSRLRCRFSKNDGCLTLRLSIRQTAQPALAEGP